MPDTLTSPAEHRVLAAAASVHAAQAELAAAMVAFEASGEWRGHGIRSFGHWCDINLGVGSRPAARLAAAAARLEELPVIRAAFAEGALSLDKVVLVAEVASARSDGRFADIARSASVAQLARICSEYRKQQDDPKPEVPHDRRCRVGVTTSRSDDGLVRLVAVLEPDDAALVLAALDARVETACRAGRSDGDDTPVPDLAARRATALVELADEAAAEGSAPVVRGERTEVRVIVDYELLAGLRTDGLAAVDGIGNVALSTIERHLCDCNLTIGVRLPDGTLNLGRTQRTPNRRQRRALQFRDRGCRYPGCPMRRFVQAHHVLQWELGGATDVDNLVLLCAEHHRLFHEGGYRINALGDGRFEFFRPDGRPLDPPQLKAPPGIPPPAPGDPRAEGRGERYDLERHPHRPVLPALAARTGQARPTACT